MSKPIPKLFFILMAGLLLAAGQVPMGCHWSEPSFRGSVMADSMSTPDFTLTDQYGQPFTLSDHRGQVVLLFFGFTYCPDVCPLTLSTWKKVEDELQEDVRQVKFVYITVDPERDTEEKLRQHLSIFSPDFVGLTGTSDELLPVYGAYGIYREKIKISDSATGYLINHTARIYVIDREGQWRLSFAHDAPVADIVHDVRQLLKS
ncbi:MAG: SCO family protein [bacterium]